MLFTKMKYHLLSQLHVKKRLRNVCLCYVLFLMVAARKHSMRNAAAFWGLQTSQLSRLLHNHCGLAVYNLRQLAGRRARQYAKVAKCLSDGKLPG